MALLFQPLTLRNVTFRNRIFVSPMCQYSAVEGVPQPWHLVHLGARATGGAGLVIVEATGVLPEGRITPGCTGLWNDTQMDAFKPIVDFMKSQGAMTGIQLAHAGRKASTDVPWRRGAPLPIGGGGWTVVGPSPLAFQPTWQIPHELTRVEIAELTKAFVEAARRAEKAGFDVIELHFAHGYLLHEFLSPLSNVRTDEYGGSLENRMRFPLEVAKAVRDVWSAEKPLFVRISATDWVEGGWDLSQSLVLCRELKALGIDLIDASSGGLSPQQKISASPGYQVPFAEAIRRETGLASGAVGLITEAKQAESILQEGRADAILLARELLRHPSWPLSAARELGVDVPWPPQYERAKIK